MQLRRVTSRGTAALAQLALALLAGCAAQPGPSGYTAQQAVGLGFPTGPFGPLGPRDGQQTIWSPGGCGAVGAFGDNLSVGSCR